MDFGHFIGPERRRFGRSISALGYRFRKRPIPETVNSENERFRKRKILETIDFRKRSISENERFRKRQSPIRAFFSAEVFLCHADKSRSFRPFRHIPSFTTQPLHPDGYILPLHPAVTPDRHILPLHPALCIRPSHHNRYALTVGM